MSDIIDTRDFDELFYCIKDSKFPTSTKTTLLYKVMIASCVIDTIEQFTGDNLIFAEEFCADIKLEDFNKILEHMNDVANNKAYDKIKPYISIIKEEGEI